MINHEIDDVYPDQFIGQDIYDDWETKYNDLISEIRDFIDDKGGANE